MPVTEIVVVGHDNPVLGVGSSGDFGVVSTLPYSSGEEVVMFDVR
jgi:hypothetical protein